MSETPYNPSGQNNRTLVQLLNNIADAIKEKNTDAPETMTLEVMPEYIRAITGGFTALPYDHFNAPVIGEEGKNHMTLDLVNLLGPDAPRISDNARIKYRGTVVTPAGEPVIDEGYITSINGIIYAEDQEPITQNFWTYTEPTYGKLDDYDWDQLKAIANSWRDGSTEKIDEFKSYVGQYKTITLGGDVYYQTLVGVTHDLANNESMTFSLSKVEPCVVYDPETGTNLIRFSSPFQTWNELQHRWVPDGKSISTNLYGDGNWSTSPAYSDVNSLLSNLGILDIVENVNKRCFTWNVRTTADGTDWLDSSSTKYVDANVKSWVPTVKEVGAGEQFQNVVWYDLDNGTTYDLFEKYEPVGDTAENVATRNTEYYDIGFPRVTAAGTKGFRSFHLSSPQNNIYYIIYPMFSL